MTAAISVIIPCHNNAPHVAAAIGSVLSQSHAPNEVIVVDDGSTDDSAAQIQSMGPSVRLIRQPRRGAAAARNAGINASRGGLLAFLDADDLWPRASLAARLAVLERTGADMVFGRVSQFIDGAQGRHGRDQAARLAGSLLVRRRAFDRVGLFDEAHATAETIDWVARARDAGLTEAACRALVLRRRIHGANTMLVHEGRDRDRFAVLRGVLARRRTAAS